MLPSLLKLPQKSIIYSTRGGTGTSLCMQLPAWSRVSASDPMGSPKLPPAPREPLPPPGRADLERAAGSAGGAAHAAPNAAPAAPRALAPPATSVLAGFNLPGPICRQMTEHVFLGAQSLPGFSFFCVFGSVQFPFLLLFFSPSFFCIILSFSPV